MNLSESTLNNIRQEGCFIRRMLPDKRTVECVAIQDGYVFKCPRELLMNVQTIKQQNADLYQQTSRRCGCGIKDCDMNSLLARDTLENMGIKVPKYRRIKDPIYVNRYIKNIKRGTTLLLDVNQMYTLMFTYFILTHTLTPVTHTHWRLSHT